VPPGNTPITPLTTPTVSWTTTYSNFDSPVSAIAVSGGNAVIATGKWRDNTNPFTGEQKPTPQYGVPWIAKHNLEDGKLVWAKSYPAAIWNGGGFTKLATAADGSFYIMGRAADPTPQATLDGTVAVRGTFVAKFDAAGTSLWARSFDEAPGSATPKPSFSAHDIAVDESGVWLAAGVFGSARIDGAAITAIGPATTSTEITLLHLAAADGAVQTDSFVATAGGSNFKSFGVAANGDVFISATRTGQNLTVGGKVLAPPGSGGGLFSSQEYWAAFAKGSKTSKWATGQVFGNRVDVHFSPAGPSALVTLYDKSIGLAGASFTSPNQGGGFAAALISPTDGTLSSPVGYATNGKTFTSSLHLNDVVATDGAYAFTGDSMGTGAEIDFGSGPIARFIAWFEGGKALHAFPTTNVPRMTFDANKNLIILAETDNAQTILGAEVKSGFYLMKVAR